MKDFLLRLQAQFQGYWQKLSLQQKVIISSLSAVILASFITLSFYAAKPDYVPLFANLSPEDASTILVKLKETKTPFQITDGGRTIRVPAKAVYETRISLASQGLPQGGSIGFEIFDKSFFGMTDFNQRLNFQRALQGELERTIRQVSSVDQARVHLVMPQKELYSEKEKEASASVVLKLKPGSQLNKNQVKAILNLIKGSVEGLKEGNISIIDTNGTLLSKPRDTDAEFAPEAVSSQFEIQRMIEKNVEDEVSAMLDRILGPGKAVVKATVELDLVKKEATEETYTPVIEGKDGKQPSGLVRSQQAKSEYFKGSGSTGGVGVPGATTNIGNVPGYSQSQSSGGSSDYTKDETVTNYEMNKKVEHLISTPGQIKRLSISVLLDGEFPAEKLGTIKQAVSSGVGLHADRGDQIVVESVAFDKTYLEKEKQEMDKLTKKEMVSSGLKTGSIVFVTVVIILFFLSMLRHSSVMKKATEEIKRTQEAAAPVAMPEAVGVMTAAGGGGIEQDIRQQVEMLAREKPQKIAEVLKQWLSEE